MLPNPVVAVGMTGSGRDAAAAVFRAAYPDLGARLIVQNEIVAHATAAARLDPAGGRSISIVEIGGQDAKFINVEGGRVVAAVLERDVYVAADPGAMGAVGIAMLAAGAFTGNEDAGPRAIDLARVLGARVAGRREFQCKDRDCANACRLELAEVDVLGERRKVVSGGQCPKYDDVSTAGEKLPKDAPNPYREREDLLLGLLAEEPEQQVLALAIG